MNESLISLAPAEDAPRYVLGFGFSQDLRKVVLCEKVKPSWAAGMWNGLGGGIEPGEASHDAMSREYREECGVLIPPQEWLLFGAFTRPGWYVECFAARTDAILEARTVEKERITIYPVHEFLANTVLDEELHSGLEASWLVGYARRFLLKPDMRNTFQSVPYDAYVPAPLPPAGGPK